MKIRIADVHDIASLSLMNSQLIADEGHRNSMSLPELEARMQAWLSSNYSAALFTLADEKPAPWQQPRHIVLALLISVG